MKSEKTELIRFRCTPTEKELIESLAQHRGITVSQLIRDMAEYQATLMALEIPEGAEYDYFMLTFGLFLEAMIKTNHEQIIPEIMKEVFGGGESYGSLMAFSNALSAERAKRVQAIQEEREELQEQERRQGAKQRSNQLELLPSL